MAWRVFADHSPADGDVRKQPSVRAGVRHVGTAGHHGDGDAAVGQGAVVRGGVDAVGALESDGTVQPRLWAISAHAPVHQRKLPAELARRKRLHVGPGAEPTPRASPRSVMPN